jgi:hypothetical protein
MGYVGEVEWEGDEGARSDIPLSFFNATVEIFAFGDVIEREKRKFTIDQRGRDLIQLML